MFVVALESYLATIPGASELRTVRTSRLRSTQNKGWRFHEGASLYRQQVHLKSLIYG